MPIRKHDSLGSNPNIKDIYIGTTSMAKVYHGEQLVFSKGNPTKLYVNFAGIVPDINLYIQQPVANSVKVNWGDGSTPTTSSSTGNIIMSHTYPDYTEYIIKISVSGGATFNLGHGYSNKLNMVGGNTTSHGASKAMRKIELGDGFGYGDIIPAYSFSYFKSLDSEIDIPNGIQFIESHFLASCEKFNSKVTIPNSVVSIENYFMDSCKAFNKPLTIPSSVQHIGYTQRERTLSGGVLGVYPFFMQNVNSFAGPLTVETTALVETYNNDGTISYTPTYILITDSKTAPLYSPGVTLLGAGASTWKAHYPDTTSSVGSRFRKLILGT